MCYVHFTVFFHKYLFVLTDVRYLHVCKWYSFCADVRCKFNYTCPRPHRLHTPMSLLLIGKGNISLEEEICAHPSTGVTGALEVENQPVNQWVLLQESWWWLLLALGPSREDLSHVPVQPMCNVATLICQRCGSPSPSHSLIHGPLRELSKSVDSSSGGMDTRGTKRKFSLRNTHQWPLLLLLLCMAVEYKFWCACWFLRETPIPHTHIHYVFPSHTFGVEGGGTSEVTCKNFVFLFDYLEVTVIPSSCCRTKIKSVA